jgi:hypothetical protein
MRTPGFSLARRHRSGGQGLAIIGLAFFIVAVTIVLGQEKGLEIRLGSSMEIGRKDLLFGSIVSICEDSQANFYVLDRMEQKVFKFSSDGRLLTTFGQKGQGPGDFQSPGRIVLTPEGDLAVLEDLYYVSFLKPDGTFIRRLDLNGRLGPGYIGSDRFYAWIWRPEDQQQVIVDSRNNVLHTYHTIDIDQFSINLPDETGRAVMFNYSNDVYVPQFIYAQGGRLSAIGISDSYEIILLDEGGREVAMVRRDLKAQKFSAKEKDFLERELQDFVRSKGWPGRVARELAKKISSTKNLIKAVRISPENVFVFRFPPDVTDEKALHPVDVFSPTGKFLGSAELKEAPLQITAKAMYFVKTDENDNIYLLVSKYFLGS